MKATTMGPELFAREAIPCASCHSEDDVRSCDGGVAFCGECQERAQTAVPYAELGGEG